MSAEALSPEAEAILRSLPITTKTILTNKKKTVAVQQLIHGGWAENVDPEKARRFIIRRTPAADALLAAIDERAEALTTERNRIAAELEAAAKDADEYDDADHALVAVKIRELAAELKTLIDNCQKQYAPAPRREGEPRRWVAKHTDQHVVRPEPLERGMNFVVQSREAADRLAEILNAQPAPPVLVDAARDTLLSVGGDLDPKPEKWYATIGRREFNRLAAALASSPNPETAGESVVLEGDLFFAQRVAPKDSTTQFKPFWQIRMFGPAVDPPPLGPAVVTIQSTQGEAKA